MVSSRDHALQLRELERVGRSLAVQTKAVEAAKNSADSADLDGAFEAAKNWRADGLIVLSNPPNLAHRSRIGALAVKAGLPTMYLYRPHGLLS
jgi:hypothetical protein